MIKAIQCDGGIYRVEHDNGQVEIYDNLSDLSEHYNIKGVLTPSMSLTFVVEHK